MIRCSDTQFHLSSGNAECLTTAEREHIRALVTEASEAVARNWPIRNIIARNPLEGDEHLPYEVAVQHGMSRFGAHGYLNNEEFRALYHQGRISREALLEVFRDRFPTWVVNPPIIEVGEHRVRPSEVALIHLLYGIDSHPPASLTEADPLTDLWAAAIEQCARWSLSDGRLAHESASPSTDESKTHGEVLRASDGTPVIDLVNRHVMKWCRAFLDEGLAAWPMPGRERGFYQAWRALAAQDRSMVLLGVRDWPQTVQTLPPPEDCIAWCLRSLTVPESAWEPYLTRHFVHLPGWAGFIRWRALHPDYPMQHRFPIDPTDYVAVRLVYEAVLVETVSEPAQRGPTEDAHHAAVEPAHRPDEQEAASDWPQLSAAWRLFQLAQFLEISGPVLRRASSTACQSLLAVLDALPPGSHGPIWQEAYEGEYRRALLAKLLARREPKPMVPDRPTAQAVFCIDVRSEVFRRHLEAQGAYETLGFAGFFGVPLRFRPFDRDEDQLLCPVLISPKHAGDEIPRPGQDVRLQEYLRGSRCGKALRHLLHELKAHPLGSCIVVDIIGLLYGIVLAGKTLGRSITRWLHKLLVRWMVPPVATVIPVAQVRPVDAHSQRTEQRPSGLTATEQAAFVETALRLMGLTEHFARLVLFSGHGSTSENNPFVAALDCGACGGNPGGPNARVLAQMANGSAVRRSLLERGIEIPDDTWFVAGRHDTTTDHLTLFDTEDVPESHQTELIELRAALDRAGLETARERCHRLPGAPKGATPRKARRHVVSRSADWSQIRPEWGLSSNAACVIGRRALTRGLNLDGRVFLHSYDPEQDVHGKILEILMTAPLIVMKMINLQYHFSAIAPWTYGSGSKILHNVVGGVGVMVGRESDLQSGLPLQSLMNGQVRFHEPMRLLAIIEAPTDRIEAIIRRHRELQQTFDNEWGRLVALDPATAEPALYRPGGRWECAGAFGAGTSLDPAQD